MKDSKELILDDSNDEYIKLNARSKIFAKGQDNFKLDVQAAKSYITNHIEPRLMQFDDLKQRIDYLVANEYYDKQILDKYQFEEITELDDYAKSFNHSFPSFMGALKFFNAYALKTFDGEKYLETYTDRALMNALFLGNGSYQKAKNILKNIMLGRFQPATPTFLNAGKKHRGEYVSCYLLRTEDNMESICRTISTSLQLSKRGGGVAVCLTNLRETGSPIKNIDGLSSGPIPVMKILEDSFTYADQLGQRQGAGAVYISAHHPDIISFLDTKRENADEKIRIKSLSLGVVIPDITFELARENKEMALFSPYDVQKVYGVALSDISITEKYYEMLENPNIKKTFISARKLFLTIAELHFESGYPYLLFEDTVNRRNAHDKKGRIIMSNLCSEIVQVSTPSQYNQDLSFTKIGEDICCNLGSLNIDKMMKAGKEFEEAVDISITALDVVSRNSDLDCAPSIKFGNANNHAVGLGAMNLHGFLATNAIMYDSPEAVDFTNIFFYTLAYNAFKASNRLAKEFGKFNSFDESRFADGSWFEKYTKCQADKWTPATKKVEELFKHYQVEIPTQTQWIELVEEIKKTGLANSHLMAVAPTGSISYLSSCTPSLQPVVSTVEVRKEGKLGRVYVPAYQINFDNMGYYAVGAYEMGPDPIINIAAAAQQHVDQAISLTLFMTDKATTRDLNRAYINAFKQGCASIYYVRIRQDVLEDSENYECDACKI
ncbi:class 1b ribonucleoside-diphosphate reductase subunit alpha [Mycoplasma putrefaciens]|uniref:Ribonucleoside-diphosphate reductase n=2 Tax=Mycoplasma putrefaciens TaxID=2123 RepID=M9WGK2_9MOLU|nr:class 1b ribonucleoside-diphosphate reductase subunit alpha [Mycoplasma putrefaciens]AEM69003.1 ribonucleoside-diphosphate reductase, alpha subunit [Mycoplasma putrefaciens KS1]AGJ90514.1 Ribonucleoside-diphosphate reductase alpha subunit [Mycoplasma putrefaciens Mput9231]